MLAFVSFFVALLLFVLKWPLFLPREEIDRIFFLYFNRMSPNLVRGFD